MSDQPQSKHDPREQEERKHPDVLPLHRAVMREMEDPRDGFAPTPVWLLFLFFGLVAWGGSYIGMHYGGWNSDIFDGDPTNLGGPAQAPKPQDPMKVGARMFNYCTQCHQPDAKGLPGTYPPLAGSEWVTGNKEVLVRILLQGAEGPLRVKGATYNGQMPPWAKLTDEQIAGVATYIRASFGNQADAVDTATVTQIRKDTAGRTAAWREAELTALSAQAKK
jgi:mono/diheme cytochrome c family protein